MDEVVAMEVAEGKMVFVAGSLPLSYAPAHPTDPFPLTPTYGNVGVAAEFADFGFVDGSLGN